MPEISPTNNIPGQGQPSMLTPIEQGRQMQLREMQDEAREKGWQPASVINFHPFAVGVSGVLHRELKIPGVSLEEAHWKVAEAIEIGGLRVPYVRHVIADPEHVVLEQVVGFDGDFQGTIKNKTFWPWQMAEDIINQNNRLERRGGMFYFKGTHKPLSNPETLQAELKLATEAHNHQIAYYTTKFNEAERAMASGNKELIREVTLYHKWATRYLRRMGVLQADPKWLTDVLTTTQRAPVHCASCRTEAKHGALICTAPGCGYILNPFEAFKQGILDLETPGAMTTMRRCSKKQLEELGLYPEVLPLDEYLKAFKEETKKKKTAGKAD